MKNLYIKFVAISLLSSACEQLVASWRKAATGSALATSTALSGYSGYFGNGDASSDGLSNQKVNVPVNYQINRSINPVVYPQATDFKNYNAMSDGTYKLPSPQAKNAANTKVIKPYFGTAGLLEANKKSDALMSDRIKVEDIQKATKNLFAQFDAEEKAKSDAQAIQGLTWSQLSSDEEKLAYLKNAFKDVTIPEGDLVLPFLIKRIFRQVELQKANPDAEIDGIISILKYGASWNSNVLTFDVYNQVKTALSFTLVDRISDFLRDPIMMKLTATHEMAHALACTQLVKSMVVIEITNRLMSGLQGHMEALPIFDDISMKINKASHLGSNQQVGDKEIFLAERELQLDAQGLIMTTLAGPLANIIDLPTYTIKPTFEEFEQLAPNSGGGTREIFHSDLGRAYQAAEAYIKWKHFTRISQYQEEPVIDKIELEQEVQQFLEESYNKVFDFLIKNKDKLDMMTQALMQKRDMGTTEMYKLAGIPRPKYDFELTFAEKFQKDFYNWVAWTGKRLKFFEDQHSQD